MARKEFTFYGKTAQELKSMDLQEFITLLPSRQRRSLKRGLTEEQKTFLKKMRKSPKNLKTHCRSMIIIPEMIGKEVKIHNGFKDWVSIHITEEMLGHRLGEFALTRKRISHSAPGVGATRSSAAISVR